MSYIAQGFAISSRTSESVTLFKKKEFNVVWAVIGFFLCLLPLLVYCIVYVTEDDEMVVIKIAPTAASEPGAGVRWSEDRQWWWDGSGWRDAEVELPPDAIIGEDGKTWWDGVDWRAAPAPVREHVQPGDPARRDRERERREQLPVDEGDEPRRAVDERPPTCAAEPAEPDRR